MSPKRKIHDNNRYEIDVLNRLRKGACTSVQLRHEIDCLRVASTIFDLRHKHGYNILTTWSYDHNPGGSRHRVGLYSLLPGRWNEDKL